MVQTHSILYVEDNDDNMYMLSRRLRRRNYTVFEARNGKHGIESALAHHPSIIIMDLVLPDVNGWEASRQLKCNALTAHIPIIALSANASTEDREAALAVGCDDYDTKPVDFERLINKIQVLL